MHSTRLVQLEKLLAHSVGLDADRVYIVRLQQHNEMMVGVWLNGMNVAQGFTLTGDKTGGEAALMEAWNGLLQRHPVILTRNL